jgi:hypothetical protein
MMIRQIRNRLIPNDIGKSLANFMCTIRIVVLAIGMFYLSSIDVLGQTLGDYQSLATGNWSALGTWQQCITAGSWAAATSYPGQNAGTGTVTVRNNHTITLNVSPANNIGALTFATGTTNATLLTITGQTLNITNALTFGAPGGNSGDQTLTMGTGTLTCASLTMPNTGGSGQDLLLTISTGSLIVAGNITMNGANDRNNITFSSNGIINVGGDFTGGGFTCSTSTVNYNGAGAQNVGSYTYYNLNIAASGTKTLAGAITVRNLAIQNSAILASDIYAITGNAAGIFTMAAGTGLTLGNTGSATAVSFPSNYTTANTTLNNTSAVTYQTGGAQNVSGVPAYGNLIMATSGTKTMSAAITINRNLSISGSATLYTNTFQVTGNATGTFSMASGTGLLLGNNGNAANILFPSNFIAANINLDAASTVTYQSGGAQTVSNVPAYGNLTIATNLTTKTCNGNLTVNGNLAINGTSVLSMGTIASSWNITSSATIDGSLDFGTATAKTVNLTGNLIDATGTIVMTGAGLAHTLNLGGVNNAITTFTNAANGGTVNYNRAGDQQVFASTIYQNLTISNGGNKSLLGTSTIAGVLTLTSGVLQLDNYNLTLSNNAVNAVQGALSATSMVETNGTGNFIRNAQAVTLPILFPIGSGGYYSPVSISAISGTVTGTLSVKAVPSVVLGSKNIKKYWDIITSTAGKTITATFQYDPAETILPITNIWVKPGAGAWQIPAGTASFGTNTFTITGTSNIGTTNSSWTASALATYYSYQTGNWNTPETWTSDPGGTTQVCTTIPGNNDVVVILDGRTVSLPGNIASTGLEVNINSGGILDMATYSFTAALAELKGQGTLKLASANFPTVTTNAFVNVEGGTTEYYNTTDFTLPVVQTTYNNLRINAPGVVGTQINNLTLNGNLHVKQGTFRINDNTPNRRQLTIFGDVTVDNSASITVGTGVTNTTADPLNIATTAGAPYIEYYDAQSHRIVLYGNFTNNGTVRFTNLSYPLYNSFPSTTLGTTTGFATVYFRGATHNTLTCNNTTDFYNLVLDKGVDQSYSLTVYSTAYPNFRLFGANIAGGDGGGSNPNLKKALWIRTGTLILKGLTTIPSLSEGTCAEGSASPNSDFYIPANGSLVLDGPDVVVLSTADDYREVNVAYGVSGGTGLVNGVGQGGCSSFSIYGKVEINDGYFSTRESGGFITWDLASGQFVINGGTIDAKQFRAAGGAGGLSSFDQSGGTFILRGRFQRTPTAYTSVSDLIDVTTTTLNTTRYTDGLEGVKGTFNMNNAANVLALSGGTIRIYDVCGDGSVAAQQKVFEVLSSTGNINVTGGTLELIPTTGTGTNSPNQIILSNAPLGNLTINRASSTSVILLNTYPQNVLHNLTITSGDFNANSLNISIGENFSMASGTTYTPGTNWTIFNGTGSQSFTVNAVAALTLKKLKIDKPVGTTLTLGGSQSTISVADSMMILTGNLADGGKTINFTTSATTTSSYLYNSGVHSGAGKIMLADNDPQIIAGDGNGIFQNLEINNTDALAAPVSLTTNITVNGTLTFSQDKLFNIGTYNVKLGASASVSGASGTRYIQTSGNAGDGGLTKVYSSTPAFNFPVGAPSTGHAAANYTPASIGFGTAPTVYGSITVVPVGYQHPNVTTTGRSLTYFWRVLSSGFTLGSATITHAYTYSDNDVITGGDVTEAGYVAARYNSSTYTWTKGTISDVDETNNRIGEPGSGSFLENVNFIDGEYTAGDIVATDPFGTPAIYYSRQTGLWSNVNTWSLTGHTVDNVPATVPGASDAVIIGGNDSVYLATNLTTANTGVQNCSSLQIESGSALDMGYNPACNFGIVRSHPNGNGNFRLTTSSTSGSTYGFPIGDFSDFNVNLGTTELYSTNSVSGTTYWFPNNISSYGNLIVSPLDGARIIFPNSDLLIYGNCITRGENADSWFCPTWDVNYPTAPTVRVAKTITINGNLDIQGGALIWYGNGTLAQNIMVKGDVKVAPLAAIDVWSGATNQRLSIGGSLINNTTNTTAGGTTTPSRCDFTLLPVTFFGNNSASITNTGTTPATGSTPLTIFETLTINKGTSQATTLTLDIGGTLTTPVNNWLTMQNGTLRYMRTDPATDFTITQGGTFTVPSTAGLTIDYANANNKNILIANTASNTNDLFLNGKLTVISGNVYIGPTNGTTNNNNDIEYSGGGASAIDIQGGRLIVNGQIRRNPATTNGILTYTQSGGTVVINGQASISTNAKLEVLNNGSAFDMSAGTITIVRGGGGNTYGDLYLRPQSSSVTGGEIIFTQSPSVGPVVDAVQSYILDANVALNNLTITGKTSGTARNATVTLLISPLVLNGDLTLTNNRSFFDANTTYNINVTIKGNFTNNGTYNHYNNLTAFSGGAQTLQGSTATDFYNMLVAPVTSLSLIRNITVLNDLTLNSGQLLGSTFDINVKGDLVNNANYDGDAGTGGVILNGTVLQHVSGTGTFGRLELNNTEGARTLNNITLQKNFILTNGIFDINQYLLTLGVNSIIEGSSFSATKMIATDGVFSNQGIKKFFNIYSGSAQTFTYPMGTATKYTPAVLTYTSNSIVGSIRLNNINYHHPGVLGVANVLQYYWEVESSGIDNFSGNLVLNYKDADVRVTGSNTEADYIAARLLIPGTSWIKAAPGSGTDNVDETNNTITSYFTVSDNLSGEYTAGIDLAIPSDVPEYTSIANGVWSDETNWVQTGGNTYPCPDGGPNGFIVIITHVIDVDASYCSAYRTTINGRLNLNAPYFGHNLGTIDGNGTLYLEGGTFPAGRYTSFFDCSSNCTVIYGGSTNYTLIADLYNSIPKLYFMGSGTRTLPNKDLTICKQLLVDGPTLDNSVNNRKLTIQGTMERYNSGAFISGSGAGATVSFAGASAQTIGGSLGDFTGSNGFNNLEIYNPAGLTINAGGAIEAGGDLLLTDGTIQTTVANKLTITNTAISCVIPSGGSSSSFVNGPLIKKINQGDDFLFPIGKGTVLGNKLSLSSTQTGTILWTAEYFTPNSTYTSLTAPLSYVNSKEYWTISATSGSQAVINTKWDPLSDLTPLMTQNGLSDMRVAGYNTGTSSWDEIASNASGNNSNGTVYTSSRITIPAAGFGNFTAACINTTKPRVSLTPSGPICGTAGIPVTFTASIPINLNYILSYNKNGVAQTPVTVSALPFLLPTDATGATYQLTGFTYNNPPHAGPIATGVVDPGTVTTYTVPTTAAAGSDQSICGGTSATLAGNVPGLGTGLWTIVNGVGGTIVQPTVNNSAFNGTNGTAYTLRWTISNGTCTSADNVIINFPLLPVQPGTFIASTDQVCQNQSGVTYSVTNDVTVTYNWNYSGTGVTIQGSGNSVDLDFDVTATSGTLSVTTTNGCGTSSPLTLVVTVNSLPTTYSVTGGGSYCEGESGAAVGLSNSQSGVNYQLKLDGVNTGSPIPGTGLAINFGNRIAIGDYTALATNATALCTSSMTGSVTISVNTLPPTTLIYHEL